MQFNYQKGKFEFAQYQINQIVFAINKHHQPWPARIVKAINNHEYRVSFYLSKHENLVVPIKNIWLFTVSTIERFTYQCDSKLKSALKIVRTVLKKKAKTKNQAYELIEKINQIIEQDQPLQKSQCFNLQDKEQDFDQDDVQILNKSLQLITFKPNSDSAMVAEQVPSKIIKDKLFVIPEVSARLEQSISSNKEVMQPQRIVSSLKQKIKEEITPQQKERVPIELKRFRTNLDDVQIVRKRFRKNSQQPDCLIQFKLPPRRKVQRILDFPQQKQISVGSHMQCVDMIDEKENSYSVYVQNPLQQAKQTNSSEDSTVTLQSCVQRNTGQSFSQAQNNQQTQQNPPQQQENLPIYGPLNLSDLSTADSLNSHSSGIQYELHPPLGPANLSEASTAASFNNLSSQVQALDYNFLSEVSSTSTQDSSFQNLSSIISKRAANHQNNHATNYNNMNQSHQSQFMDQSIQSLQNPNSTPIPFIHQKHSSAKEDRRTKYSWKLHEILLKLNGIIQGQRQSLTVEERLELCRIIDDFKISYLTPMVFVEVIQFLQENSKASSAIQKKCYIEYLLLKERWQKISLQLRYHEIQSKDLEEVVQRYLNEKGHLLV